MSGPKVVRIVTREEIEALCRRHLAVANIAVEELRRCAKRHNLLQDRLSADLDRRLQSLQRLFDEGRFSELQKEAALTVAFAEQETENVRVRAIAAAEQARSKRRRIADAATTLTAAIQARGGKPPKGLLNIPFEAETAGEDQLTSMQAVLHEGYSTLSGLTRGGASKSDSHLELARRLGASEVTQTFAEWLAEHSAREDKRCSRLDHLIARIDAVDDQEAARPFKQRAAGIPLEASEQRRNLLIDSLILDLSSWLDQGRRSEVCASKLRGIVAQLRTINSHESRVMQAQIANALDRMAFDRADDLVVRAQAVLDAETVKISATARRRAILGVLAELGYEVREGMDTVWARDGRLVIRKPNSTDYGIELGAPSDISRLQVQVVASDRPLEPRDAQRDRDMEVTWCSEFTQMRQFMVNRGAEIVLERAVGAGEKPVKAVTFMDVDREIRKGQKYTMRHG